jgi:shikimate dehydrogenase
MKRYGCIGKKLGHSFSKEIHAKLAPYSYDLIELAEEDVGAFLKKREFAAINVTIPYKTAVIPYLDSVSEIAERIGAVNTVVNREGRLHGYNTDYFGMKALVLRCGLSLLGKKVLILGTGGTSRTAQVLARDLGAGEILTVSRRGGEGHITYADAASRHADAEILFNTTPVGMFPNSDGAPIDLAPFLKLEGVVDAVYNPLSTDLVLAARARGIRAEGGLYMLVMQAVFAVEKFLNTSIPKSEGDRVFAELLSQKENIVLTGMPGSGKSTVGHCLAQRGYRLVDTDGEIEGRCGLKIRDFIEKNGEDAFRDLESEVIRDLSAESGLVIATGGGAILREENLRRLGRNGRIFFLDAPLSRLSATHSRPLSDTEEKLARLYRERMPIYRKTADVTVPDLGSPAAEAEDILAKRTELFV